MCALLLLLSCYEERNIRFTNYYMLRKSRPQSVKITTDFRKSRNYRWIHGSNSHCVKNIAMTSTFHAGK